MELIRKNPKETVWKKRLAHDVVLTKVRVHAPDTLFPKKLAKARHILGHTRLLG